MHPYPRINRPGESATVDTILEIVFGPWTMILFAALALASLAVGLPIAVIAALEFFEMLGARSYERFRLELARIDRWFRTSEGSRTSTTVDRLH
jgi:hypothetical protein